MILLRKTLFYVFLLIFLVGAPLIVFYALGYLYRPWKEQGIVKTGLIYLDSAPRGAVVVLGKKRMNEQTPAELHDLMPGRYEITLIRKGYQPWKAVLPVAPGKATVIDKILLLREKPELTVLSKGPYQKFFPVGDDSSFLLVGASGNLRFLRYDELKEKLEPFLETVEKELAGASLEAVYEEPESPQIILRLKEGGRTVHLLLRAGLVSHRARDISEILAADYAGLNWDKDDERYLYPGRKNSLGRIDLETGSFTPEFIPDLRGYGFYHGYIYALKENGSFLRIDGGTASEQVILNDPIFFRAHFGESDFYKISVFSRNLILFLSDSGRLLGNRLPYVYAERDVRGLALSDETREVLLWKENGLGVLRFPRPGDESLFEKGPKITWIYENANSVHQAFWVYEGSQILFRDSETVFLIPRDSYGPHEATALFSVQKGSDIHYSDRSGNAYFLDPEGRFVTAKILPKTQLGPLSLPEFEGLETKESE